MEYNYNCQLSIMKINLYALGLLGLGFLSSSCSIQRTQVDQKITKSTPVTPTTYPPLHIYLCDGTVNFHNIIGQAGYQPLTVTITNQQTKNVTIHSNPPNFFNATTITRINYNHGVVKIDVMPGPYHQMFQPYKATQFIFNPTWVTGWQSTFSTRGFAAFSHATIKIKTRKLS